LEREEVENKVKLTPDMVGDVKFKNVAFRYGSRVTIFDDFNLSVPKGKITAVVGESGSGKSTLMSLLQNMYKLQSGLITIGNLDIKHISNDTLRQQVSVVPQQIDLFAGSVIENIALGDFEPDMKRVLEISEHLGITEFVEQMPNGFNTYVGENGSALSGGQKQRIAIARALYRDPQILILDEATSALDSISEQYVQRTIRALREQEKTVIIIAHRLSTIKNADKIVVLDHGKVVEEGLHDDLLRLDSAYNRLWTQQFGIAA
jgi:ATP-binding cassette subfamily B protein